MASWDYGTAPYYVYNGSMNNEEDASRQAKRTELAVSILLTIWIVTVNVLFTAAICLTKSLRERPSNWLLITLSLADLLVGLLVTSLAAYQRSHDLQWELNHHMCVFWLLLDVLLNCVVVYTLLAVNIDRLVFIVYPIRYSRKMGKFVIITMIILTWVIAMCIVMPFFFQGRSEGFNIKDNLDLMKMCYIELLPKYAIVSAVLTYFVPGILLLGINGCSVKVTLSKIRDQQRRLHAHPDQNIDGCDVGTSALSKVKRATCVLCVANSVYLIMWFPFFFINILSSANVYHALSPKAFDIAIWLAYANAGVNPLVWLVYPDIRKAFFNVLRCRFERGRGGFYLNDDLADVGVSPVVA